MKKKKPKYLRNDINKVCNILLSNKEIMNFFAKSFSTIKTPSNIEKFEGDLQSFLNFVSKEFKIDKSRIKINDKNKKSTFATTTKDINIYNSGRVAELFKTYFHEIRHAIQFSRVKKEENDRITKLWKLNYMRDKKTQDRNYFGMEDFDYKNDNRVDIHKKANKITYILQPVEVDAELFAYYTLNEILNILSKEKKIKKQMKKIQKFTLDKRQEEFFTIFNHNLAPNVVEEIIENFKKADISKKEIKEYEKNILNNNVFEKEKGSKFLNSRVFSLFSEQSKKKLINDLIAVKNLNFIFFYNENKPILNKLEHSSFKTLDSNPIAIISNILSKEEVKEIMFTSFDYYGINRWDIDSFNKQYKKDNIINYNISKSSGKIAKDLRLSLRKKEDGKIKVYKK